MEHMNQVAAASLVGERVELRASCRLFRLPLPVHRLNLLSERGGGGRESGRAVIDIIHECVYPTVYLMAFSCFCSRSAI